MRYTLAFFADFGKRCYRFRTWPYRLTVRTRPFQGWNRGSIPRRATIMNENFPQIIKDVGFDFDWSVEKVCHKEEYARTMKADLIHPIDIMTNKGRWLILDGLHRLMKASILKMKTVKVRKIPRKMIPKINT